MQYSLSQFKSFCRYVAEEEENMADQIMMLDISNFLSLSSPSFGSLAHSSNPLQSTLERKVLEFQEKENELKAKGQIISLFLSVVEEIDENYQVDIMQIYMIADDRGKRNCISRQAEKYHIDRHNFAKEIDTAIIDVLKKKENTDRLERIMQIAKDNNIKKCIAALS